MKEKIPIGISEYIRNHFREDFLFEVKDVVEVQGHSIYKVEVSKDDYIHKLSFNEAGALLKEDVEPAFPPDGHEEQTYGEIPE